MEEQPQLEKTIILYLLRVGWLCQRTDPWEDPAVSGMCFWCRHIAFMEEKEDEMLKIENVFSVNR